MTSLALKHADLAAPAGENSSSRSGEKSSPAPVVAFGQHDLTEAVSGALQRAFAGRSSPVKEIARVANANVQTAKMWWQGRNCPDALYLLRLMAAVPELQAEVRRLTGMQADLDPEFDRAMQATMALYTRVRERP